LCIWWLSLRQLVPLGCYIRERFGLCKVKNQHHSITAFKVGGDYRPVALLTSSIPDIEFDRFTIDLYFFDFEIDCGDSWEFLCQELTLNVLPKDSSFTYIGITNHNYFVSQFSAWRKISILNHYYCRPSAIHPKYIITYSNTNSNKWLHKPLIIIKELRSLEHILRRCSLAFELRRTKILFSSAQLSGPLCLHLLSRL